MGSTITLFSDVELNGNEVNHIENVFMLTSAAHTSLGKLNVWLEPIEGSPNRYLLKKANQWILLAVPVNTEIELINQSSQDGLES
ncbi:hypothetical protein FRB96_004179 [Tulasnella sp. 330]|nr:hypothetical protein FRB96_004179 [Tulasnella sp. 330]KAG8880712.1 hypothetical protein FRB97_000588 [Tulasnella sp. 331]